MLRSLITQLVVCTTLLVSVANADGGRRYSTSDFKLKPGEVLVAVDGVPVGNSRVTQSPVTKSEKGTKAQTSVTTKKPCDCPTCMAKRSVTVRKPAIAEKSDSNTSVAVAAKSKATEAEESKPKRPRNRWIVNRDPEAYAHALREAKILAARGEGYHRFSDGGHPLGVAPGCRYAGTGYSRDADRPNHCWLEELPSSRLVARAMVPGPNGTYFWSAHYK